MLEIAIEQAAQIQDLSELIVSTDSEEIANAARDAGASVPFARPKEFSEDDSPEWYVWRHALEYVAENYGRLPEKLTVIPTTSPLRLPTDIEKCIQKFDHSGADVVLVFTDAKRNPFFNMVRKRSDGSLVLAAKPERLITRRQNAPAVYDLTTVAYVVKPEYVLSADGLFNGGRIEGVYVPPERAVDIDTPDDLEYANWIAKRVK